jgi:protoheme IX farnesyltransferase
VNSVIDAGAEQSTFKALARDLVALTKPRIISLLLVTTIAPMFVAGNPTWQLVIAVFVGGYLMAGGANTVNMYLDRDIDDRMARTRLRPIPGGRMHPRQVLAFGVLLAAAAVLLLGVVANVLTAALALAGFYFYVFIYTRWLKRTTPQNIVIGGAAGAVPPLVGCASASGHLGWAALVMFGVVFLWTPPHFWALALMIREHYAAARVPMLPVVRGERETANQIVWYTIVLVVATLVPVAFGVFDLVYGVAALVLGAVFAWLAWQLWRELSRPRAVRLFHYSLLYLALLFVAMALDVAV